MCPQFSRNKKMHTSTVNFATCSLKEAETTEGVKKLGDNFLAVCIGTSQSTWLYSRLPGGNA